MAGITTLLAEMRSQIAVATQNNLSGNTKFVEVPKVQYIEVPKYVEVMKYVEIPKIMEVHKFVVGEAAGGPWSAIGNETCDITTVGK